MVGFEEASHPKSLDCIYCKKGAIVMYDCLKEFFKDVLIIPEGENHSSISYWLRHYGYCLQRWPGSDFTEVDHNEKHDRGRQG